MGRRYFFLSLYFLLLFIGPVLRAQSGSDLTFSEILFYPSETNGEYVEIYNTSSTETIDLSGIKIKYYTSSSNFVTAFIGGSLLAPGKFAIIIQGNYDYENGFYKSLIPPDALVLKLSTNNFGSSGMANTTGRPIYLLNASDETIDAYTYTADNAAGYSDEKTALNKNNDSGNWTNSATIGGTPGFKSSVILMPRYSSGSLVINEIMYDPDTGSSEFLEFFNASRDSIQLAGLQLYFGSSGKCKLSDSFIILPPEKYFVLSSDSAIFNNYSWLKSETVLKIAGSLTLSNDGALLVLKDFYGTTLDSLSYSPGWHSKSVVITKNRSLERVNPHIDASSRSNWNSCAAAEGATPGRRNSIFAQNLSSEKRVTINPNPFSPDGDGFEDFGIINFDLTQPLSQVRIKVFDSSGRLVRSLAENRLASSNNSVIFDGMDESGQPLRIGIYILLIETAAEDSGNVTGIKIPVVIARKL